MSTEATVLLLDAESLPGSLEEQLAKRNVFVEHAPGSDVAQVLPVVVPDLLVQSGEGNLTATLEALTKDESAPPLVVIADRATIRTLREAQPEGIKALIPKDLPIAAVAHRLSTMARRSADGVPIDSPSKARPASPQAKTSPKPASPSKPVQTSPSTEKKRGSLAPAPLAPRQQVKILESEEFSSVDAEESRREQAALEEAEAQQRAVEVARAKRKAEAEANSRSAAEKRRAEIEQRALERNKQLEETKRRHEERLEERRREQERKREERRQELAEKAKERAAARAKASLRPKATESTPSEVRALDDLFPTDDMPEPATTRTSRPPSLADLAESEAAVEELEQTTQAVNISAFASDLDKNAKRASEPAASPTNKRAAPSFAPARPDAQKKRSDEFDSVKKTDELSVIVPLPVDMRVDLSPQSELKPIRLALLDIDLTRADSIAAELREKGMKIHPVTPDPTRTRWPMLRRFAPQGLVVDEKSMARGAAEWVETFRGDPFLRHVPVVLVRFSRLFDEASGKVTLDPLLHMIEHIGREEFALLDKLGPGRRVDLWLSQVAPYRLVEMLTKEDRNTRLDCKSDAERMVWHLGPGYAGRGKLADLKTDAPKSRLSPEEALFWLLGHEDCQVAVHEHAEPLAHASESKDAEELLREMTEALAAPERHESVRPGAPSEALTAPSFSGPLPPAMSAPTAAPSVETLSHSASLSASDPPPMRAPATLEEPPIELPISRSPFFSPERTRKIRETLAQLGATLRGAYDRYAGWLTSKLDPLGDKIPSSVLRHAPWAILILSLLVLLLLSFLLSDHEKTPLSAEEFTRARSAEDTKKDDLLPPAAKQQAEGTDGPAEKETEEEPEGSGSIWKVRETTKLPSCEERLGPATPKSADAARAVGYWKNARRLLMVGNTEEAIESMCLAGLLDSSGPASEGLAEYYLGQRSLEQAERWIRESLEADPERRKSQELLSDIENQKGNVEEARKIILRTMRVSADETKKMELTARKLRQDARLARKGGDLPRAERELRRAALLSPKDAEIAAELGDVLLRRQAPTAAARWAAHALELDPNYSEAMILSGRIAEVQGKRDKARTFYEMVPTGDTLHGEAQRRRARL